jgi:ATP-dependent DNA helicase RecG
MAVMSGPTFSALLTPDDLRAALAAGPGERLALLGTRATARQIAETAVAMANAQGGLIVLGATAEAIPGLEAPEQARSLVMEALAMPDPPLIVPLPLMLTLDGHTVCVLPIPPGLPHVYNLKGQYLTRSGRHNRPLLADELRRLLLNRSEVSYERYVPEGATLADLDDERVAAYQDRMTALGHATATALLLSRGCAVMTAAGPRPTVAGLLLFGRDPQRWVRSATLTCVRYAGETMGDAFVREDIAGVLPDQIRRGEAFVVANMRRGARLRGLAREEVPEYPISVVREAIVNAVAHRDYSIRGDDIRVLMFSNRLEVYSPGRLPGHVTLENLLDERYSRNEAIVQVLAEMGFIERLGYGIDRMIAVCESEGLPRPRFAETAAGFRVTIFGHGPNLIGAAPPAGLWAHLHLNPRQEQALAFLQTHRRITNRDYQALCPDASPETLRRDLADLVDRGILLKIGEKRATYYVLK